MLSTISRFTKVTIYASTLLVRTSTTVKAFSTRIPRVIVPNEAQILSSSFLPVLRPTESFARKMSTSATEEAKKRVLVPIAEDSEEIETTCITDVLARFGADVVVASVKADGDLVCKMSRGIKVK